MQEGVFLNPPSNFSSMSDVVGSWCRDEEGRFLLLRRTRPGKGFQKWAFPGGKREESESLLEAIVRELHEEMGLCLPLADFKHLRSFYVRLPESLVDFTFHIYLVQLPKTSKILLNGEHDQYRWVTMDESMNMDLMFGQADFIKFSWDEL
jgi:8-oxo-dGTP pyrophosphatase MutT (NUDIX family)